MVIKMCCQLFSPMQTTAVQEVYQLLSSHYQLISDTEAIKNKDCLLVLFLQSCDLIESIKEVRVVKKRFRHNLLVVFGPGTTDDFKTALKDIGAKLYLEYYQSENSLVESINQLYKNIKLHSKQIKYQIADLSVDLSSKCVSRGEKLIKLRKKEFDLLTYLCRNAHRPVSTVQLLESVWGYNQFVVTKTVQAHISSLRRKIDDGQKLTLLHTFPCRGYMLSDQVRSYKPSSGTHDHQRAYHNHLLFDRFVR